MKSRSRSWEIVLGEHPGSGSWERILTADPGPQKLGFGSRPRAHRKQAPGDVLGAFSAPGLTWTLLRDPRPCQDFNFPSKLHGRYWNSGFWRGCNSRISVATLIYVRILQRMQISEALGVAYLRRNIDLYTYFTAHRICIGAGNRVSPS